MVPSGADWSRREGNGQVEGNVRGREEGDRRKQSSQRQKKRKVGAEATFLVVLRLDPRGLGILRSLKESMGFSLNELFS